MHYEKLPSYICLVVYPEPIKRYVGITFSMTILSFGPRRNTMSELVPQLLQEYKTGVSTRNTCKCWGYA